VAYDATGFDGGIDADRSKWTRATAQGVLALGLADYSGLGDVAPVDPGLDAVDCTPAPPVAPTPTLSLSATTVVAGGSFTVTGKGFGDGEGVDITLHSTPIELASAVASADGTISLTATIPADVEPGEHTVTATAESGATASATIEVTAAPTAQPTLPVTGSNAVPEALFGLGLVLIGAGLVQLGRDRRRAVQGVPGH
jgi:hypothetical protein